MATNKHAVIRYQVLDRCFRNTGRKYFIEDLVESCTKELYEHAGIEDGIQKRQIQEDIKFMESDAGYRIKLARNKEGKRSYYRYVDTAFSINSQPLNESEANQLKEAMLTLSRFRGMPQFEWVSEIITRLESSFDLLPANRCIVEFEQNPYLLGLDYVSELYHAIVYKKVLEIRYKGFKQKESRAYIFHPHYLKQFNNRWFLFGNTDNYESITNLALDRIEGIREILLEHKESKEDFAEYFEDVIGVSIPEDGKLETITLKVEHSLLPYILSKPLHGSQKLKNSSDNYSFIELSLMINFELESLLLSFGEKISVLEPQSLKIKLINRIQAQLIQYDSSNADTLHS